MINKTFFAFLLNILLFVCFSGTGLCSSLKDFGTIIDSYKGETAYHVDIIQDNRSNLGVQESITYLLSFLCDKGGASFIFVPDFFGIIDTAVFSTFPDDSVKKDVSFSLLSQGLISGAEYFAVNSKVNNVLYGIEQHDFYASFKNLLDRIELGEVVDTNAYLIMRSQKNAVVLAENIVSKKIKKSVALGSEVELKFFKEALAEKGISYNIIKPMAGEGTIDLEKAALFCVTDNLGRTKPIRMTLFEHDKYRIYFLNTYISLLKSLKNFSGEADKQYISTWKKALSEYVLQKKEFFQQFLIDGKKDVAVDEIFSLFGILDTVEDEFSNLLEDIVVHERISLHRKRGETDSDFIIPVTFYNISQQVCYYFFDNNVKSEKRLLQEKLFSLGNHSVASIHPAKFLDILIKRKNIFLDTQDVLETLSRIGNWSFLNIFQKRYLLAKEVIDLRKVLKELKIITESASSYDASKQVVFEKQLLTVLNALAEFFVSHDKEMQFLSLVEQKIFKQTQEEMEKVIRAYIQFFRMSINNKGYFDVIVGDIFYRYDNSIKAQYYGVSDMELLKNMIRPKTILLMEKVLQDNDIFGIIDNFSNWVVKRFGRGNKISFGMKQDGVLSVGTKDYRLVPGALKYINDYFIKRMSSYAHAVELELDDFLRKFDFSRIKSSNISNSSQLNFIMMSAYIQKNIKDILPYEILEPNYFKRTNLSKNTFLLIDVQLFETGYIGGSWIEYLISQGYKIYIYDVSTNDYNVVKEKLRKIGFKTTDLDDEIDSLFIWTKGRSKFSSEMLLIENKEDIVAKIVSQITLSMAGKGSGNEIYIYLFNENVNKDILFSKIKDNVHIFLIKDAVSLYQCITEFFAYVKDSNINMLLRRLNYSEYDKKYIFERDSVNDFKRDPKTMALIDLFILARQKINAFGTNSKILKKEDVGTITKNEK